MPPSFLYLLLVSLLAACAYGSLLEDLRVSFDAIRSLSSPPVYKRILSRRQSEQVPIIHCKSGSGTGQGSGNGGGGSGGGSPESGGSGSPESGGGTPESGGNPESGGSPPTTGGNPSSGNPTSSGPSSSYQLVQEYQGTNFFNGWDFWTLPDPTDGIVHYVDEATGRSMNLVNVNSAGNAVMRVDTTPQIQGNRTSIRIQTELEMNTGLWLMDAIHMPTGCGTWPAFWTNGPNWPVGGEIDIVEGVNAYTQNQATIHTDHGCVMTSTLSSDLGVTGTFVGPSNCAGLETGNQGCGLRSTSTVSFGAPFNSNGGGVYASQLSSDGPTVWFWPRDQIPSDVANGQPNPSSWGTPLARWPAAQCNPTKYFYSQAAIFDTTLCGQWASGVWSTGGIAGQAQSCAQMTGSATCEDYVRNNGAAFNEAYWEVKSVRIYQLKS